MFTPMGVNNNNNNKERSHQIISFLFSLLQKISRPSDHQAS